MIRSLKESIYVIVQHSDNEVRLSYGVLFNKECPVMSNALPKMISLMSFVR